MVKTRKIAQDMCALGIVEINGIVAKGSKEVKIGDKITLKFLESTKIYEVLAIPATKSIPKAKSSEYAKLIN